MKFHEYAEIYRMLPDAELQKLAEDIRQKGQLLPITIYEGQILDGRNRYRACEIASIEPKTEVYDGDDPLGLISSLNDHRRHDPENERALVGARMANLKKGGAGGSTVSDGSMETSQTAVTIDRAAELAGTSRANIKRAKPIVQSGIQELQDMAESGEISIRAASEVAKLPEDEQRKAVAGGVAGVKAAAKKIRSTRKSSGSPEITANHTQETPSTEQSKPIKIRQSNALGIWATAKSVLDRISKTDTEREEALQSALKYIENRINKKI